MPRRNKTIASIVRYLFYTILLLVIETIICILCFEGELLAPPMRVDNWHVQHAVANALQINMVRFIFYYALYVAPFCFFMKVVTWKRRLLQAAVANCALYVVISLLYTGIFPDTFDYLTADFFYFLVIATFLSPFFLGRKVAEKLLYE